MAAGPDCDVVVVGGGIVGLAVANELLARRPGLRLRVLEAAGAIATGQTGHNSGVIHAGIYYEPGSLKARLCVAGRRSMVEFCEREGVPVEVCGKLIVARDASEVPALDRLQSRGEANGVPGLRRIGGDEIAEIEPHCVGVAALHSPETAITDFAAVARALGRLVEAAGGSIATGARVDALPEARFTVVCAGAGTDRLARGAGAPRDVRTVPVRGSYLRVRSGRADLVRGLIYPVPDPSLPFLGVHLTRHIGGEVSLGPTALPLLSALRSPRAWRMARRWWRTGIDEIRLARSPDRLAVRASEYVPELGPGDFEPWFAGVRAQAVARDGALVDDFVVHETERALFVRNAPSPAATSSLELAKLIADRAEPALA